MENKMVLNQDGQEVNFAAAVNLMDDEIREKIHRENAPCLEQEFFDLYCEEHKKKYGSEFVVE